MVSSAGITDKIKSLNDLQTRCHLHQAEDDRPVFGIATNSDEFVFVKL
ncbi:MAG: hypothetical protein SAL70_33375 [Scytonema sp. PMC 1070.18]|nr:hypothetical protein [Scytonema sp. PMC 1070.18]